MTLPPVLVLDGQTNQALACVRSLGRDGYRILVASRHRRPLSAWSRWCTAHHRIGGEGVAEFATLRTWAVAHGVQVVLPMTERSCLLCNEDREAWEGAGIRVGCAEPDTLIQAFDKSRTLAAAEACGVSVPPTRLGTSEADIERGADELGYPCVIKSRFSEAWVDGRASAGWGGQLRRRPGRRGRCRSEQPAWSILAHPAEVRGGQGQGCSRGCATVESPSRCTPTSGYAMSGRVARAAASGGRFLSSPGCANPPRDCCVSSSGMARSWSNSGTTGRPRRGSWR